MAEVPMAVTNFEEWSAKIRQDITAVDNKNVVSAFRELVLGMAEAIRKNAEHVARAIQFTSDSVHAVKAFEETVQACIEGRGNPLQILRSALAKASCVV